MSMQETVWPPQSVMETLLSSPGGRKKAVNMLISVDAGQHVISDDSVNFDKEARIAEGDDDSDDVDNDIETLELRLEAIKTELKLKNLKRANSRKFMQAEIDSRKHSTGASTSQIIGKDPKRLTNQKGYQVPVSPVKKLLNPLRNQQSPGRVLMGLDKGRAAKDVSLKAPQSLKKRKSDRMNTSSTLTANVPSQAVSQEYPVPHTSKSASSFNSRMAERQGRDLSNLKKRRRTQELQKLRSSGFGLDNEALDRNPCKASKATEVSKFQYPATKTFTRDEVVCTNVSRRSDVAGKHGLIDSPSIRNGVGERPVLENHSPSPKNLTSNSSNFEPISSTPLSNRTLPQGLLERAVRGKKVVGITDLLRKVKYPDWAVPETLVQEDEDFIVFGIVGWKSAALDHRDSQAGKLGKEPKGGITSQSEATATWNNENRKFMVMKLVSTDLKWSVDLYLFGSAYSRWRNLNKGSLVAILNPGIMPPPPGKTDTNKWSLKLDSDGDTVLEVGQSDKIGWCQATKKNGERCGEWIDGRSFRFCEWHISQGVEKAKSKRMETQGSGLGGNGKSREKRGAGRYERGRSSGAASANHGYDKFAESLYYVSSRPSDGTDTISGFEHEESIRGQAVSEEERNRRFFSDRQNELQMARKLGALGNGAGAEYMRRKSNVAGSIPAERTLTRDVDIKASGEKLREELSQTVGLDVHLSPVKRKMISPDDQTGVSARLRIHGIGKRARAASANSGDDSDELEII